MIQSKAKQKVFNDLMDKLEIQPSTQKSNAEKFYEWMKNKVKHPYADNEMVMANAFSRIIEY
jgi:hypothetical protein